MMHTMVFLNTEILQNFTEFLMIFFRSPTFFQWFSFDHLPFFNDFLSITYLFSMISFDHLPFFNDFLSSTYLFSMIFFRSSTFFQWFSFDHLPVFNDFFRSPTFFQWFSFEHLTGMSLCMSYSYICPSPMWHYVGFYKGHINDVTISDLCQHMDGISSFFWSYIVTLSNNSTP
jgi:hypothetical protein